jgi:hypothetical protein
LAGVGLGDEDTASVLLAGELGGQLDIWVLGDNGGAESVKHRRFVGIGSGWSHTFLGYAALVGYARMKPDDPMAIWIGLEMAARFSAKCGPPVRLVRVTKSGVVPLKFSDGALREESA